MYFSIYDVFIRNAFTNMFRPVLLPSSGWCCYYKNIKHTNLMNCVTDTA
jgi:hypothetical protein